MMLCVQAWGVGTLCTLHTYKQNPIIIVIHSHYSHSVLRGVSGLVRVKIPLTGFYIGVWLFQQCPHPCDGLFLSSWFQKSSCQNLGSRASTNLCLLCCKTCEPLRLRDLKISILCPPSSEVGGGEEIPCKNDGVRDRRRKVMKSTLTDTGISIEGVARIHFHLPIYFHPWEVPMLNTAEIEIC